MKAATEYFKHDSFGTTLEIEIIGNIESSNTDISLHDTQKKELIDLTAQRKGSAHMAVYYVGEPVFNSKNGNKIMGWAGCIGCICKENSTPNKPVDIGWRPRGNTPIKHCFVTKTKFENKQGKVRS